MSSNVMSVAEWRKTTEKKAAKLTPKARVQQPYKDQSKYWTRIALDPGTNTGVCLYREDKIQVIETMPIHKALEAVKTWMDLYGADDILVRFEDARLRTWYGSDKHGEKKKGAGSVERDCAIWQGFLDDLGVDYDRVHPRDVKATTAEQFQKITGYSGRTSIHAREAAWMVI